MGPKTVISKSTSKITFSRGNLLDTCSVKALEQKFQRKTNPGPVQFGERPSWTQHRFSSAIRRAGLGSTADSARPFAELDQFSSAKGRVGPETDSARPFTELDQPSSANGRAGSTETRLRLVLVTPLPKLHRTHSCFVSAGGTVGTLRFKNCGTSSFLERHSD